MARQRHYYHCNVKKPTNHCKTHCFCGMRPHIPEGGKDKCTKVEFCKITGKFVKCVKLTKRQLEEWEAKGWVKPDDG